MLQNNCDNVKVKTKLFGLLPITIERREWSLIVNYSEKEGSKEEKFFLAQEGFSYERNGNRTYSLVDMTEDQFSKKRIKKIQEIVNDLEKLGYKTKTDQLALFINNKISVLIFSS